MSRWLWMVKELLGRLGVRAGIYGVVAVVTALAAIYLKRFIPPDLTQKIGADSVDAILHIMAASMLSVTIFSISTLVAAYAAATNNVTPRATRLLLEDRQSHIALSTFLGAFLFSIVGIIALQTGVYGVSGRLILFLVTIGVLVMIVFVLVRWIDYLARLGRVNETIERVESSAATALENRLRDPHLGGRPANPEAGIPDEALPVEAELVGYVRHIDMESLSQIAEERGAILHVTALPGKLVNAACPLAFFEGEADDETLKKVRKAFVTGKERSFEQDPRFGLAVLHEIAVRALSPAVNDPGTAIHIIGVGVRILSLWARRGELAREAEVKYPRVHVPPLEIEDLFDDFFPPIERDGAGILEVMIRLQKAYVALAATGDAELHRATRRRSTLALQRARDSLRSREDRRRLDAAASSRPQRPPRRS